MSEFKIGAATVRSVWEMNDSSFEMRKFFPLSSDETIAEAAQWLPADGYDKATGAMVLSIHAWLVDTGRHLVLIDTCVGNDKERHARKQWTRMSTPFLARLAELGVKPDDIDYVLCTHLHADHVGWNTRLLNGKWVPTFPRAKYIFGKTEYEYWDHQLRTSDPAGHHLAAFTDSVVPIVDAGQALIVDNSFSLDDCMTIEPAPGHTPGHIAIWLRSEGACCVFSGDIIHHLAQLRHPDWSCMGCQDPVQSASTRTALLSKIADADVHLMTGHFLAPHAGRIKSTARHFEMEYRCEKL